jgi:5-methylthioadenosine/S-adenosylhomocysteine deaminase
VACQQAHVRLGGALCPIAALEAHSIGVGLGTDSAVGVGALDVLAEARLAALLESSAEARTLVGGAGVSLHAVRDARGGSGASDRLAVSGRLDASAGLARRDYTGLGAETVLRLATLGGACALGLGSQVGSIEVGKAADLVCIDLSGLACQPLRRPAEAIVFGATRHQVSDVWTAGRAAVRDGRLLTFDEQEIRALARGWAERIGVEMTARGHK